MNLVRPYAAEPAAVEALASVLRRHGGCHRNSKAADEAVDLLVKHHLKDVRTFTVGGDFALDPRPWTARLLRAVADADLPRARQAEAVYALAQCLKTEAWLVPWMAELQEVDPAWATVQERRYGKDYLARLRRDRPAIEDECVRRFAEVADKYGDVPYPRGVNRTFGEYAKGGAFAVKHLGIGKLAPDFTCTDASGRAVRLHDLKGRVVVLDFWYVGCIPCAEQFPHLRQLCERHAGKPFSVVGISADEDRGKWEAYLKREQLPWTQWLSGRGGVVAAWNVSGFPTRYLIDHKGIIRDSDGLKDAAFDRYVARLVAEAPGEARPK